MCPACACCLEERRSSSKAQSRDARRHQGEARSELEDQDSKAIASHVLSSRQAYTLSKCQKINKTKEQSVGESRALHGNHRRRQVSCLIVLREVGPGNRD